MRFHCILCIWLKLPMNLLELIYTGQNAAWCLTTGSGYLSGGPEAFCLGYGPCLRARLRYHYSVKDGI